MSIRMNRDKHDSQGNDLPLTTSVDTAGNLIAENLLKSKEKMKYEVRLTAPQFDAPVRFIVFYDDPEPIEAESAEEARKIVQQMIDDGEFTNTGTVEQDPDPLLWNEPEKQPEPEIDEVVRVKDA
ncbi:MAG: hypothetical protein CMI54_08845 [Parcubacteria group bacterium]|nr:hypothetical protein [Parcubacteria group bacterium]|tara:strand:+ start:473 stop:847 length:375 start_codon:yes stop_codon:yes gene_type:complete